MSALLTISVSNARFFAYHGLYAEEQTLGNEFEVNLSVAYDPGNTMIDKLAETINYASLYAIVKEEMQTPRHLLETFVMEVANRLHSTYPGIKKIDITLTKLHAPIVNFTGSVGVKYTKEY